MVQFAPMPPFLATERLRLRRWTESDAPVYRLLWTERDNRSRRRIGMDGRPTVEDLRANIRSQLAGTEKSGIGLMAVERLVEQDVIGYCGLIPRDEAPGQAELAFEFLRQAHGRGFATEAARAIRDAAAATGRPKLWAEARVWNLASRRVLEKVGFSPAGEIRVDLNRGDTILMVCRLATADAAHIDR